VAQIATVGALGVGHDYRVIVISHYGVSTYVILPRPAKRKSFDTNDLGQLEQKEKNSKENS